MFQNVINQTLALGIEGEYADDSPRRDTSCVLLAQGTEAVAAEGKLAFTANPSNGDTVTIGAVVYKFVTTLAQAGDIKIGSALADTLESLANTINGEGEAGTDYFAGTTTPNLAVVAEVATNDLELTAASEGYDGNLIALASSSANATVTAFAGGANATEVLPKFACAFTQAEEGDEYAKIGGTGFFRGVLVNPKMYANYANLQPTLELPNGSQGSLCTFGHVFVKPVTAFAIGNVAAYDIATGKISAYVDAQAVPATAQLIANSRFIKVSGQAGEVAILELGN